MAFALFRTESDQRINVPIRTNTQKFCLVRTVCYQAKGFSSPRNPTRAGAFYRRLSARVGKAKAVTATARKIAVLFYNALRHGMDYADPGASYYEERYQQRVLANLQRRAKSLGYVLQQADTAPAAVGVS